MEVEIYSVQLSHNVISPYEEYNNYSLWSTLEGAKRALREEVYSILMKNPWLNNEDCIKIDTPEHFRTNDDEDYYDIIIVKQVVHD